MYMRNYYAIKENMKWNVMLETLNKENQTQRKRLSHQTLQNIQE